MLHQKLVYNEIIYILHIEVLYLIFVENTSLTLNLCDQDYMYTIYAGYYYTCSYIIIFVMRLVTSLVI